MSDLPYAERELIGRKLRVQKLGVWEAIDFHGEITALLNPAFEAAFDTDLAGVIKGVMAEIKVDESNPSDEQAADMMGAKIFAELPKVFVKFRKNLDWVALKEMMQKYFPYIEEYVPSDGGRHAYEPLIVELLDVTKNEPYQLLAWLVEVHSGPFFFWIFDQLTSLVSLLPKDTLTATSDSAQA